ncbi:MAG TPA: H-X9-DG-CTERM domain-containing protein [Chthoniobacteraceae bacterium]|nr:H-X9-DG-CTERM domain-containing protein [Chthoniobacteraceae bacterium]
MNRFDPPRSSAFSLVELLAVVFVLGVLLVLVFPAYMNHRKTSAQLKCAQHLRLIGAGTAAYVSDHAGVLPLHAYVSEAGGEGSGALGGTWYYNLAPYLGVPRTEVSPPETPRTERTLLGTPESRITAPCVFTCPAHSPNENNINWKPTPMTWPADKPVSYAPPTYVRNLPGSPAPLALYHRRMSEIPYPGKKIWICDSATPALFNPTAARWDPEREISYNFAYQAFSRHRQGGNALFFDGHVEWLPLSLFRPPFPEGKNPIYRYFATNLDPSKY